MKSLSSILLLMAAALVFTGRGESQVVIVANAGVKADTITRDELRDVFTGASKGLRDGSRAVPVLLAKGATTDQFLATYMGMKGNDLIVCWRTLLFAGQAALPKSFDNDAAVVDHVAHTAGAIGYIGGGSAHVGVKVLAVK